MYGITEKGPYRIYVYDKQVMNIGVCSYFTSHTEDNKQLSIALHMILK